MPRDAADLFSLINRIEVGLILVDQHSNIRLWNEWMHKVTGVHPEQAKDTPLQALFTEPLSESLTSAIQMACEQGLSRRLSHQLHPRLLPLNKPGQNYPLNHSVLISPVQFDDQPYCLIQIQDVSNTVRREQHLREAESLLRFEKQALAMVAQNLPLSRVLNQICHDFKKLVPNSCMNLLIPNTEFTQLCTPFEQTNSLLPTQVELTAADLPPAQAARQRHSIMTTAVEGWSNLGHWWCQPFFDTDDQLAGVVQLAWPSEIKEPTATPSLLERITQLMALALQSSHQIEQIRWLAQHDSLTGLYNRQRLNELLLAQCRQAEHRQQGFALFFIDLDGFKAVNDRFGHNAGDALLIELAQRLQAQLPKDNVIARLGGDELVVIATHVTHDDEAFAAGNQLICSISQPFSYHGEQLQVGASVGFSIYPDQGTTPRALLTRADNAMYLAKTRGKGQVASCEAR